MLSAIAAVLVAVWFYYSAPRSGRAPVSWAVSGLVIYALTALLWTLGVTPMVKDAAIHTQSGLWVFVTRYAYIIVAVLAAAVVNTWLNRVK